MSIWIFKKKEVEEQAISNNKYLFAIIRNDPLSLWKLVREKLYINPDFIIGNIFMVKNHAIEKNLFFNE